MASKYNLHNEPPSVDEILAKEAVQEMQQKGPNTRRKLKRNPVPSPVEPLTVAIKPSCPVTYGLDNRPFGDTPPRDVPRSALVAFALDIIRREGPQSTNALLDRAFHELSQDDRAALRQRLPKWIIAECRSDDPPLSMRRERSKAGGEKRENLFGFWPEPRKGKSRQTVDVAEVLTAIAELKIELVTLRQVQSELLQRQNILKEGFAAMLEKLTWNSEI